MLLKFKNRTVYLESDITVTPASDVGIESFPIRSGVLLLRCEALPRLVSYYVQHIIRITRLTITECRFH
jgi:hypothetical protein